MKEKHMFSENTNLVNEKYIFKQTSLNKKTKLSFSMTNTFCYANLMLIQIYIFMQNRFFIRNIFVHTNHSFHPKYVVTQNIHFHSKIYIHTKYICHAKSILSYEIDAVVQNTQDIHIL